MYSHCPFGVTKRKLQLKIFFKMTRLNFIDLFSGAGGLSCGLELAGMRCLLGVDCDKHAIQTFAHNHHHANTYDQDIKKLTPKKLKELCKNQTIHAVVGGPPCQGFSTVGLGNPQDRRNSLFLQFVRIVKITKPYFIIVENVTGLLAKKNETTLKAIFSQFQKLGYHLDVQVMSAEKYGVPEIRRRTIIIGSRLNSKIVFPTPSTLRKTVGDAWQNLASKTGEIFNHDLSAAAVSSAQDLAILKYIPEGKGIRYQRDELAYLPPRLRLGVDWNNLREKRFRQTKYFRLDRTLPGPTIMTLRHNYYHPTENRYLTAREAAALQSFPNDFKFFGPLSAQWRQIGNAVPPLLGKALGKTLIHMYQTKDNHRHIDKHANIRQIRSEAFAYRQST